MQARLLTPRTQLASSTKQIASLPRERSSPPRRSRSPHYLANAARLLDGADRLLSISAPRRTQIAWRSSSPWIISFADAQKGNKFLTPFFSPSLNFYIFLAGDRGGRKLHVMKRCRAPHEKIECFMGGKNSGLLGLHCCKPIKLWPNCCWSLQLLQPIAIGAVLKLLPWPKNCNGDYFMLLNIAECCVGAVRILQGKKTSSAIARPQEKARFTWLQVCFGAAVMDYAVQNAVIELCK